MCIFIIGGFGGSINYMMQFSKYLQYYTQVPVHNYALMYGNTFDVEVSNIIIKILNTTTHSTPIILFGFSTGCILALKIAQLIKPKSLFLCNPAEVITRFAKPAFSVFANGEDLPQHIIRYGPIIKKSYYPQYLWNNFGIFLEAFINFFLFILGGGIVSYLYYHNIGKYYSEPKPKELRRVIFSTPTSDLKKTAFECLIKQNINDLIRNCNIKIHVITGVCDFYKPCSRHISNNFDNKYVIQHILDDNHHMLYNRPNYCAKTISNIMLSNGIF